MIKSKRSLIAILVLFTVMGLYAEPISTNYTAAQEPVYGWDNLKENAEYPSLITELNNGSSVVLTFKLDVLGNVSNIQVLSSGGAPYDQAAIEAVLKTKWYPAMQNGKATPVSYELPFEFYPS